MDELLLARIIAGETHFSIGPTAYMLSPSSPRHKLIAQEIYYETLEDLQYTEVIPTDKLPEILQKYGIWDERKQLRLDGLQKDLENLKVGLFENSLNSKEQERIRKTIKICEDEITNLSKKKHSWDHLTAEGIAALSRFHYLLMCNLRYRDSGELVYPDQSNLLELSSPLLNKVIDATSRLRIDEKKVRQFSRTEPWRSMWSVGKNVESVFGKPVIELTDEQLMLSLWSKMLDNIHESPDCPSESVIQDDYMLDGWIIVQKRKREKDDDRKLVESKVGDKIKNSDEIFVVAGTIDDARKVNNANTMAAQIAIKQRMNRLQRDKVVPEALMPDTQQEIRMKLEQKRKS